MGVKTNRLPPFPESAQAGSVDDYYSKLGAVFLLDAHCDKDGKFIPYMDYYPFIQLHIKKETCFLALCDDNKPIAYLLWNSVGSQAGDISLVRKCAPFGDYPALQDQWQDYYSALVKGLL